MDHKIEKRPGDRQWIVNGLWIGGGDTPEDALAIWELAQIPQPEDPPGPPAKTMAEEIAELKTRMVALENRPLPQNP